MDSNYLATFMMENSQVVILVNSEIYSNVYKKLSMGLSMNDPFIIFQDIRLPSVACAELKGHTQSVNSIAWVS